MGPLLLPRLKPIPTMALTDTVDFPMEATEAMDVLTVSLLTDAPTEDMVATDVATMARGRLRLLLRLRLMLTTATGMDAAMEATDDLTDSLLTLAMDALTEAMEATDVATTARGRLRLLLWPRLLTDTAAMEATADPTEDTVAPGPMAAMAALTDMATESRQQPQYRHHMNNLKLLNINLTKYKFKIYLIFSFSF